MIGEAIILAGGEGTRLKPVIHDLPKAMAPINGRPFMEYQLDYLNKWSIKRVVISVGYQKEKIKQHFGESYKNIELLYAPEEEPLGTGGAVINAFQYIEGPAAFIFNGDTYFDINLKRVNDFRWIKETDVVIVLRFENDTSRYGTVTFDGTGLITGFFEKKENGGEGYINGGAYLINKGYLDKFGFPSKFSLEKDFFARYFTQEEFYALRCFSYFRDIGIPEDYQKAQDEFKTIIY